MGVATLNCPNCLVAPGRPVTRMMPDYRQVPPGMVEESGFECSVCGSGWGYKTLSDQAIRQPGGPFGVTICDFCGGDDPIVEIMAADAVLTDYWPPQRLIGSWGAALPVRR